MTLGICVLGGRGRGVGRWADTVRSKAWTTSTHGFQRQNSRAALSIFGHEDRWDLSGSGAAAGVGGHLQNKASQRKIYICIPIYRCVLLDINYAYIFLS